MNCRRPPPRNRRLHEGLNGRRIKESRGAGPDLRLNSSPIWRSARADERMFPPHAIAMNSRPYIEYVIGEASPSTRVGLDPEWKASRSTSRSIPRPSWCVSLWVTFGQTLRTSHPPQWKLSMGTANRRLIVEGGVIGQAFQPRPVRVRAIDVRGTI